MPPLFLRGLQVLIPALFVIHPAKAQNVIQGTDVGIHVFGTRPNIQASDSRMGTLVHAYVRRQLGERTQHELNLGMGLIQGVDFKTRILPVDYRILAFPFSYSKGRLFPGLHYGDMYAYAGLGVVNSTPVEIPRPDDPLTVDAGRTLRSSEFLDLSTNWSVHLPVGIGTSIHLDDETQMVFNAGYQVLTQKGLDGYFAMSVGLKFSKPFRPRRAQSVPAYRFPMNMNALANIPAPVAIAPMSDAAFLPRRVYFESSMSSIRPDERSVLDEVARHMLRHADLEVVIRAHADSSGDVDYNRILAEDRAWQATLHLLRAGVEYGQIRRESFGSDVPETDNLTPENRALNRRIELQVRRRTHIEPIRAEAADASVLALAEEMTARPELRLRIESWHPVLAGAATQRFLATAQASRIQRLLIEQGVDADRIKVVARSGGTHRVLLFRVAEAW